MLGLLVAAVALAVVVALLLALLATGRLTLAGSGPSSGSRSGGDASSPAPTAEPTPRNVQDAGRSFLRGYVDPDGRVVRRDQGGDTVSEGQAYAMLIAVGLGDREAFARVWDWTRMHLLRPDGTLSWRWQDGRVQDAESASDADLDAARALVLAGARFGQPNWTQAGTQLGKAVLNVETVRTSLGLVLTAGSWAGQQPYAYNPSYASPVAYAVLERATGDARWKQLAAGSRAATAGILDKTDLPPDWAQIHADGAVDPMPGAAGRGNDGVRYSYDAARLPIRYAESCDDADVAQAAALSGPLERFGGTPAARDLGGRPLTAEGSPVAAVGQAAALAAGGDDEGARRALLRADDLAQRDPTYYGAAWDALGRMMLEQNVLGGCGRLES
ncbi:endoglucanase [Friedmanniella endophytica]|uniref:Endoglucanase n=1 Tax=Microlunatus kandeliicorticis TaxID=1759536 RepID=A0A7W3P453_9ACTN|nr:glycosyl hydrolase family 8 [Microlunatus kandeliicorticis]MBA8792495.1 endoglucanase [Microlunatus kandeliicorticis]